MCSAKKQRLQIFVVKKRTLQSLRGTLPDCIMNTTSTPPYHHGATSDPRHHEQPRLPTNHDNRLKTKHDSHTPTSPTSTTKRAPSMSPACHVMHLTPPLTTPAAQTTTTPQHLDNRATGKRRPAPNKRMPNG